MDKFKLTFAVVFLATLLFSGCQEKHIETDLSDEVTVKLRLDETMQEKAYVRIMHDGSREDFWYYILTQDLETDAERLLKAQIDALIATDGELVGNVGVNKSILITGLEPKTDYRVIVSRIDVTGELIGNVAELEFRTKRDPAVFEEVAKDVWEISYTSRKLEGNDETEIFTCDVKDPEFGETYIPCVVSKEDFKKGYKEDLRKCFEDYVEYLTEEEHVKWSSKVTAVDSEFTQDRFISGDYILFMIGVDSEGALTGYYSRTDYTLKQEDPTDAYSAWIGKWLLTGSYLNDPIEYEVEIVPEENNLYLRMYGWESSTAFESYKIVPEQLPIKLYFDKTTGYAYVVSEKLPDLPGEAQADMYDFFLYGVIDHDGKNVNVDVPNMRLARLQMTGTDNAVAYKEQFKYDTGVEVIETTYIYFNYIYTHFLTGKMIYEPVTVDNKVPSIETIRLERR